jgi:CRP-like cAMP-binding protein
MNPADLFHNEPDAITLACGETLFKEGDEGHCMYVVLGGILDVKVGDTLVEKAGPGALLGEMALVDKGPRIATVVATTDCRLAKVDERRFQFLVQETPYFATHVMKELVGRLRRMNLLLERTKT